jgi:hypothetical protein
MFDVGYFPPNTPPDNIKLCGFTSSTAREYVARPFLRPSLLRRALDTHKSHAEHTLARSPREFPKCRDEMAFPDA